MKKIIGPGIAVLLLLMVPVAGLSRSTENPSDGNYTHAHKNGASIAFWGGSSNDDDENTTIDQGVCRRNHESLQRTISELTDRSKVLLETTDAIFANVDKLYYAEKREITEYEEQMIKVEIARTGATATVNEVADFEFELDCNNPDAGRQLAGFGQSIVLAISSLTHYRTELTQLSKTLRTEVVDEQDDTKEEAEEKR